MQHDAQVTTKESRVLTPPHIHEEMKNVEGEIRLERSLIHDWEIDMEIGSWVLDVGNSRACDTKYWKTIDLY